MSANLWAQFSDFQLNEILDHTDDTIGMLNLRDEIDKRMADNDYHKQCNSNLGVGLWKRQS